MAVDYEVAADAAVAALLLAVYVAKVEDVVAESKAACTIAVSDKSDIWALTAQSASDVAATVKSVYSANISCSVKFAQIAAASTTYAYNLAAAAYSLETREAIRVAFITFRVATSATMLFA